ncbi:hypothetical protein [Salinivibrio sp. ES.052]|uniref:hypothetical protein n=1 Tax=Salinivibrio sp. ES.052 TaxID=1882823 RepID=UPI00092CDB20|nr:hypothetical protein [Salinivibrio sp. ES.052]SIN86671.1 hypothetical protein SAMN05444724_0951 [Salinivibrio sp. ES.052]
MNQYVFFCQPNHCDQFTYLVKENPNYLVEKNALLEQGLIIEGDVIVADCAETAIEKFRQINLNAIEDYIQHDPTVGFTTFMIEMYRSLRCRLGMKS